ncbi:MAG: hypothetical protein FWJ93_09510 [Micromonosporaceae bacterium]
MSQPIYDQSGQLVVGAQYNSDQIVIANINEGPGGKRCPRCNASPMRRTAIFWEENTRPHGNGYLVTSSLALRAVPPSRPAPPEQLDESTKALIRDPGRLALGGLICLPCMGALPEPIAFVLFFGWIGAVVWLVVSLFTIGEKRRAVRARNERIWQAYQDRLMEYERDKSTWQRSWLCGSCGTMAVPR